jgi:dolichyl-diphosphooligosaccharide--protein glycosyltransferase
VPLNKTRLPLADRPIRSAGIGNRTSIADGNTWNHEHIALLGRALVSSEKNGHAIARHLADYVLVWTTRCA